MDRWVGPVARPAGAVTLLIICLIVLVDHRAQGSQVPRGLGGTEGKVAWAAPHKPSFCPLP